MLPSTLKYLYSVEPVRIQMILCAMLHSSIAHSIISTRLFRGKMHSDWFNGIEILQGRWQHGEKVGYCYPSGQEKTLCKWDTYVCPAGHEKVKPTETVLYLVFLSLRTASTCLPATINIVISTVTATEE